MINKVVSPKKVFCSVQIMETEFHDLHTGILKTKVLKEQYVRNAFK